MDVRTLLPQLVIAVMFVELLMEGRLLEAVVRLDALIIVNELPGCI